MKCIECGSTQLDFQYDGTVVFETHDGVIKAIFHGGVIGVNPRYVVCRDCGLGVKYSLEYEAFDPWSAGITLINGDELSDDGFYSYGGE